MVYVPRSAVQIQQSSVGLPSFYLDTYEVSNREYKRFIDAGGYRTPEFWTGPFIKDGRKLSWEDALREMRDATGQQGPSTWRLGTYPPGQDNLPVQGVSWYEAAAFAARMRVSGFPLCTIGERPPRQAASTRTSSSTATSARRARPLWASMRASANTAPTTWPATSRRPTSTAVGDKRYILGGAWNEPSYQYLSNGCPRVPFNRSAGNGFRCMKPVQGVMPDALNRPVPSVVRDYSGERPGDRQRVRHLPEGSFSTRTTGPTSRRSWSHQDGSPEHWRVERVSRTPQRTGGERIPALLFARSPLRPPSRTGCVLFPPGQKMEDFQKWGNQLHRLGASESGRAVLMPMYKGLYERRLERPIVGLHAVRDLTMQHIEDLRQSVDYVYERPDLDESRLAFFGVSVGAALAPIALAVDPRFKAAILWAGGFSSLARPGSGSDQLRPASADAGAHDERT